MAGEVRGKALVPGQLPSVVIVLERLSVGAVDSGKAQPRYVGADQPCPQVLLAGKAASGDFGFFPAENGHAVPGFLAVADGLIARGAERIVGKLVVREFQFL